MLWSPSVYLSNSSLYLWVHLLCESTDYEYADYMSRLTLLVGLLVLWLCSVWSVSNLTVAMWFHWVGEYSNSVSLSLLTLWVYWICESTGLVSTLTLSLSLLTLKVHWICESIDFVNVLDHCVCWLCDSTWSPWLSESTSTVSQLTLSLLSSGRVSLRTMSLLVLSVLSLSPFVS